MVRVRFSTTSLKGLPPEAASRATLEYLAVLDDAAFGPATPVTPRFISPADPASRWTGASKGAAFFAYATNYLIDLDHAVIVDVEASTGRAEQLGVEARCPGAAGEAGRLRRLSRARRAGWSMRRRWAPLPAFSRRRPPGWVTAA